MAAELDEARRLCAEGSWVDARLLLAACAPGGMGPHDHELLAVAALLTGEDALGVEGWERSHHGWLAVGDVPRAVRAAFWLAMTLARQRQEAPAGGWFARADRLLTESGIACAETARLLVPAGLQLLGKEPGAALEVFTEAERILASHPDPEVGALTMLGAGQARIKLGDVEAGVRLLDEAMVATTTDDVLPIAVGIIYCAVLLECNRIFDIQRARQWTVQLDQWSARQQGLVPFRGQCLVHRSEMTQSFGDWDGAVKEADDACAHLGDPAGDPALGMALYQRGELHRLRGEFVEAEAAFNQASEFGRSDTPGRQLALLGKGEIDRAARSMRTALSQAVHPVHQARCLAAAVEILLAVGDLDAAAEAGGNLRELADSFQTPVLDAAAVTAAGMLDLAAARPTEALPALHAARESWHELAMPYEVARVHALIAQACAELGDDAGANAARLAARSVFESLGALPDLARLDGHPGPGVPGGLSPREVEVLGLIAAGDTNRQVAQRLVISEKTVARHVSNIFMKLDVSSRSAATAWAWEHGLAR